MTTINFSKPKQKATNGVRTFFSKFMLCLLLGLLMEYASAQCPEIYTLIAPTHSQNATLGSWTAPATGGPYLVRITAAGAKGGDATDFNSTGGSGAIMTGTFTINAGQKLDITAGAPGQSSRYAAGGGGGSGVYIDGTQKTILVIAGAGGGSTSYYAGSVGGTGQTSTSGQTMPNGNPGGENGNGGSGSLDGNGESDLPINSRGAGGGGYLSAGGNSAAYDGAQNFAYGGGAGFNGAGGSASPYVDTYFWGGTGLNWGAGGGGVGGGGGGAGMSSNYSFYWGGAGGGYSGGGGAFGGGGGGGSINNGTNQTNTAGANAGGGYVTIECLGQVGATSSVLGVDGPSSVCKSESANLMVTITGGTSPYTVVYSDGTNEFTINDYTTGTAIPVSPAESTTYSLVSVTDANEVAGSGNSGTPTISVTPIPALRVAIGDYVVTATNDGTDDKGAFAVCNSANNIGPSSITDVNGSNNPLLKFQQTYVPVNVSANLCATCTVLLPFSRGAFTASLVNPALQGNITLRWRPWVDANDNNIIDAAECAGDWVEIVITVNPVPVVVATPATQAVCSGAAVNTIVLSGNVSGTTFHWTRDNATTVTGIAASGSDDISGTLTNTTTDPVTVTFTITPTANDCVGEAVTATVTVNPTPTITCPSNITVSAAPGSCSAAVNYAATATGTPAPTLTYSFSGATTGTGNGSGSGSAFNTGTTTVMLTATNTCGMASCSFTVTVSDVQAPVINKTATPVVLLWSPNHSYKTVSVAQFVNSVTDNCSTLPVSSVVITKVTSDEAEDAPGSYDGNTKKDIVIAANCKSVQLRSERMSNRNGRVYTLYLAVTDASGNTGTTTVTVEVPLNQSGSTAVDDVVPLYTVNSSCSQSAPTVSTKAAEQLALPIPETASHLSLQNYPNPFRSFTTLRYTLPANAQVQLSVYNELGQKIAVLARGKYAAGTHQVKFDGSEFGAGIYLYQLETIDAQGKTTTLRGKMIRLK